ncbi:MAG: hypothetical protein HQL05_03545 [Nitrospirae bacterium]|uniref:hypothetical protein n=1 Tax=Candidatus Magnetobacterium casense TaxID=1455061 RepID=UPI0012DC58FC|nr:hypothetical protein [Candidatus Magnetobacterium casensis]MBF0336883.1 hypothetical protein [Nitrospirota bacterium]
MKLKQPDMKLKQPDLLAEISNGRLFQIEFQLVNDKDMALRMLRNYAWLSLHYGRGLEQVVLYVGNPVLKMPNSVKSKQLAFKYTLRDMREIKSRQLLESTNPGDMVLSILGKM